MFASIRKHWHDFRSRPPGRRFQDIHKKKKAQSGGSGTGTKRYLVMAGGVMVSVAGVFFLAVPGPGLLVLAIGLALMASESQGIARFLDWAEVRLRAVISRALTFWRERTRHQRYALAVTAGLVACAAVAGLAAVFFKVTG